MKPARLALAFGLVVVTGALAREIAAPAFGPPDLDGVSTGLRGEGADAPGLSPFVFHGNRDWPALRFHARAPLDWRGAGALAVPVENPAAAPFAILLRLDDSEAANGDDRSLTGIATIPPHARATVLLPLSGAPLGMRGRPPTGLVAGAGDLVMPDTRGAVDLSHIVALHISGVRMGADHALLVGTPTLRDGSTFGGGALADPFGQAIGGQWPEKVGSDGDLRRHLAEAAVQTRRLAMTLSPLRAPDGGVAATTLAATGFFRVAGLGGRWVLVTPAGHPFFSLGVDAVTPDNTTVVDGRRSLFEGLPASGGPLAAFYGHDGDRQTFDVGAANLERGLGPDWRRRWPTVVTERLLAWGFNTLGTWSDERLAGAVPHVVFHDVEGDSAMVPMGGRALPDPFDPRFLGVADAVAAAMTLHHRDDPTLIGYFSGNELPWGEPDKPGEGIAAHVLALAADSPARRAFMDDLRAHYPTPQALAAAWGLADRASWDDPIVWSTRPTAPALADRNAFESRFAARYFSIVAAALRRHDPNHLYLGTRFASATPAVVEACARFCDVLTFNVYGPTPEAAAARWRGLGKPVLIGEFHFGSRDRGSFWPGMVAVPTEADRGTAYATYLSAALADPSIVGCHWYQYADEPLTGRPYDGENGHIGLVAVTDVPFSGFIEAVARANRQAFDSFAAQVGRGREGTDGTRP